MKIAGGTKEKRAGLILGFFFRSQTPLVFLSIVGFFDRLHWCDTRSWNSLVLLEQRSRLFKIRLDYPGLESTFLISVL